MIYIIIFVAFSQCKFVDLNKKMEINLHCLGNEHFNLETKISKIHLFCPKTELIIFLFAKKVDVLQEWKFLRNYQKYNLLSDKWSEFLNNCYEPKFARKRLEKTFYNAIL